MDRKEIIESIEDYEPYARDLPCVTIKSGLILDVIAMLKDQQNVISGLKVINDGLCEAVTEQKQIVRCKDCRWGDWSKNIKGEEMIFCYNGDTGIEDGYLHEPEWFCAEGIAKDTDVLNKFEEGTE